jgi:hypothetical protein
MWRSRGSTRGSARWRRGSGALLDRRITALRDEFRDEMHAGFARLDDRIAGVEMKIDQRFADLLKWSFTFWVGSTLTLVVLSRLTQ